MNPLILGSAVRAVAERRPSANVLRPVKRLFYLLIPLVALLVAFLPVGSQGGLQKNKATLPPKVLLRPGDRSLEEAFDRALQPWAFVLPHMPVPANLVGIRAKDCGVCHTKIYAEWKASTHAHALSDLQFQAELAKADSPKWLCLNCHIPLEDQRETSTLGLKKGNILRPITWPNPNFSPALRSEAITCATCHLRVGKDGKSYIQGPRGSKLSPHPVRKDPERLRAVCLRCHDPQGDRVTPNLLCWFTTRKELEDGGGEGTSCADCHMPTTKRRLMESHPDLPVREVHRHTWPGAGIPKEFALVGKVLGSGWKSGLNIRVQRSKMGIEVSLRNARAGHAVPTGDPERFVLVRLRSYDLQGGLLREVKKRIGQTWKWSPAKKIGDNRIGPGETRKLSFDAPAASRTVLEVLNVRLSWQSVKSMVQSKGLNEDLLPGANQKIRQLPRVYPYALYVYRQVWEQDSSKGKVASPEVLIELSKKEREIPPEKRGY